MPFNRVQHDVSASTRMGHYINRLIICLSNAENKWWFLQIDPRFEGRFFLSERQFPRNLGGKKHIHLDCSGVVIAFEWQIQTDYKNKIERLSLILKCWKENLNMLMTFKKGFIFNRRDACCESAHKINKRSASILLSVIWWKLLQ